MTLLFRMSMSAGRHQGSGHTELGAPSIVLGGPCVLWALRGFAASIRLELSHTDQLRVHGAVLRVFLSGGVEDSRSSNRSNGLPMTCLGYAGVTGLAACTSWMKTSTRRLGQRRVVTGLAHSMLAG